MKRLTIMLLFALAGCSDPPSKPSHSNTPSVEARRAACEGNCERADVCLPELGMEGVEDMDGCVQACVNEGTYFADHYKECWDEALAALECLNSLSCEEWLAPLDPRYDQNVDGRYVCSGTDEVKDPGPATIHGNCIADVGAAQAPWDE